MRIPRDVEVRRGESVLRAPSCTPQSGIGFEIGVSCVCFNLEINI
jgi:hypothetical protein